MDTNKKQRIAWADHLIKLQVKLVKHYERNLQEAEEHLVQLKAYKILKGENNGK